MNNRLVNYLLMLALAVVLLGCNEEEPTPRSTPPVENRLKMNKNQFLGRRSITRFDVNAINRSSNYQGNVFEFISDGKIQVSDSLTNVIRSGNFSISADSLFFSINFSGTADKYTDLNGSYHLYFNNSETWDFTRSAAPFYRLVLTFKK